MLTADRACHVLLLTLTVCSSGIMTPKTGQTISDDTMRSCLSETDHRMEVTHLDGTVL